MTASRDCTHQSCLGSAGSWGRCLHEGLGLRVQTVVSGPDHQLHICGSLPPNHSFLEHLHKHQGSVLRPDYKTAFPSFEDALHRLLPYHVYQGALPSPNDYHRGEASPGHPIWACGVGVGGEALRSVWTGLVPQWTRSLRRSPRSC